MENLNLEIFSAATKQDWEQIASKQLKGGDPNLELTWQNAAAIDLGGYYDLTDLEGMDQQLDFFSKIDGHSWKLFEEIKEETAKEANEKSLAALMGGCDGVIFNAENQEFLEAALSEIDTAICDVSVFSGGQIMDHANLTGFKLFPGGNCAQATEKINPIKQINEILRGIGSNTHIYRYAFKDFFLEISTVRALRFLLEVNHNISATIHTHIPLDEVSEHQWFFNTSSGLASILGGSHSVDFSTAQGDSRISRNVGNLIREESGITEYSDQCGGAYYLEVLTNKLIQAVDNI